MNQLDELIRDFSPSLADADRATAVDVEAARRRLRHAVADERRRRFSWRAGAPRRIRGPLALVGAVAAALLVTGAVLPGREGTDARLGPSPASAAAVLARTAAVAARAPATAVPSAHQYLYLKWIRGWTTMEGANGVSFAITDSDTEQDWEAPNGSGRQRIVEHGFRFVTPADRAAWQASHTSWPAEPSGDGTYPAGAYFDNCAVPPTAPAGLPTEPAALLRVLVSRYERGRYNAQATLWTTACLLEEASYPPLRSALYRMLARLPGIEARGERRDPLGREGVVVAITDRRAGIREELLIDPARARLLELDSVAIASPPNAEVTPWTLPKNTVIDWEIFLSHGVVASTTALPGGARLPSPARGAAR